MRRTLLLVLVALALVACEHLDRGFGTDGRVPLAVAPGVATKVGNGIAVLGSADDKAAIVRYDADGERDMAFGGGDGVAALTGVVLDGYTRMATLGDGDFVVTGRTSDGRGGVVRYTAGGALDTAYGEGGVGRTASEFAPGPAIAVSADGRVVLARVGGRDLAMFTSAGRPDSTFGVDGIATPDVAAHFDALTFQSDGKLVVAGSDAHFVIARVQRDGTLDRSFGSDGVTRFSTGDRYNEQPTNALVQPDGRIVVLARWFGNGGEKQLLARLLPDGTQDSSFGLGGISIEGGSFGRGIGHTLHLRPDGRIVTAGQTIGPEDVLTTQWRADGRIDDGWGDHGDDHTDFGQADSLFGGVLLDDGRLLGFGYADHHAVLVRYTAP
jgi:uncharacterized delta-60 repeat protein